MGRHNIVEKCVGRGGCNIVEQRGSNNTGIKK